MACFESPPRTKKETTVNARPLPSYPYPPSTGTWDCWDCKSPLEEVSEFPEPSTVNSKEYSTAEENDNIHPGSPGGEARLTVEFDSDGHDLPSSHSKASVRRMADADSSEGFMWDIFLSHLQRNGQDAVISLQVFLLQSRPDLRCFIDLDVDMKGDLTGTIRDAVANCRVFLFFITDGILNSPWCLQEIRWAVECQKRIVMVRETDERHGGIEMNAFLKQVPPDLMETFVNTIAIPWYRQPAFRAVSVDSILKACAIEDSFAEDIKMLDDMRAGLLVVARTEVGNVSAFDYLSRQSFAMRIVLFLGGYYKFSNPRADMVYCFIFASGYTLCALVCLGNVVYQGYPYHNFGIDFTTAYSHLPAIQCWYMWRQFVRKPSCCELLHMAITSKEAPILAKFVRYGGWIVLGGQLFMVGNVLSALSMPWVLGHHQLLGVEDPDNVGHLKEAGLSTYVAFHSIIMFVLIPPTIAAFIASHVMFVFLAALHVFDIRRLSSQILVCMSAVSNFFNQHSNRLSMQRRQQSPAMTPDDQSAAPSVHSHSTNGEVSRKHLAMERELTELVVEIIRMMFSGVQDRIDRTCEFAGNGWIHLLLTSVLEILAVRESLIYHLDGGAGEYRWWYVFGDLWHLGGGVTLVIASLSLFAAVSAQLRLVAKRLAKEAEAAGCSASMQSTMLSFIAPNTLGMHVFGGSVFVDAPQVAIVFFIILCFTISTVMALSNHLADSI